MAGAGEVMAGITRRPGVVYRALVPNVKGAELALAADVDEIEVVVSASETHNRRNVRRSVDESIAAAAELTAARARCVDAGRGDRVDRVRLSLRGRRARGPGRRYRGPAPRRRRRPAELR